MRIGLIADTHDNVPMVEKAVALFNREGVSAVFHAGDYVSPFSVKTLMVNPGECGGWLRGRSTVAIADLETQQGEILDL